MARAYGSIRCDTSGNGVGVGCVVDVGAMAVGVDSTPTVGSGTEGAAGRTAAFSQPERRRNNNTVRKRRTYFVDMHIFPKWCTEDYSIDSLIT
jgi:hypothetical protein